MKKYKIIWISIVVVLAMAVVIAVSGGVDSSNNSDTIKIGFIGALSGADPSYGEAMKGGVEIAVEEINSQGGIGGKKVEVIYEDGKCIDSKIIIRTIQSMKYLIIILSAIVIEFASTFYILAVSNQHVLQMAFLAFIGS